MAIPSKQIGWSNESNLLWQIARQLQQLTQVAYASGGGGGNFIPLTGTIIGSPVSGDIQVSEGIKIAHNAGSTESSIFFGASLARTVTYNTTNFSYLTLEPTGLTLSSTSATSKGISGIHNYSANITDLDYTQKIYVDTKQPQLSGSGFVKASGTTISYDNNSYVQSILNQSPNSSVTGTVSETLLLTYLIPANTIPSSAGLNIKAKYSKPLQNGTATIRIKINTTNNFATATTIATYIGTAGTASGVVVRSPAFQGGNMIIFTGTVSLLNDESVANATEVSLVANTTADIYFFVSIQNASILDTTFLRTIKITN